ncbi:MAG TPA: carboxypeptidase regulatory-like domain-containing protein [Bryobacteraceae bacterium]|nr:carboxypeptidase regulatory-like domain-containing protein [Bryobacteraceae bacterium]
MTTRYVIAFPVLLLLAAGGLPGQETRGTISGTVTDPSASIVAGAPVRLANTDTGVEFTATTNEAGQYRFLFLNPGVYKLTAEVPGFRTFVRDNIQLHVSQSAVIDVMLTVGHSAESITVTSEAPLLESEKADRGLVINNKTVADLPLNIRNPIMLSALSPGIVHTSGTQHLNPFSNNGISSWSINGGRGSNNEFLMDGAPNNAVYNGANNIAYVPPVDAVEEFKVMTGSYDAQYGRTGGGVINVSIRSGANAYHGSAYEFLKRTGLNANTFANNAKRAPRQGNALDQYGFTLGGPISIPRLYNGRDKTFFFFAYEDYREDTYYPGESISSVPSMEQRRGDFSKTFDNAGRLIQIFDPMTGNLENASGREPFPGNIIPANRINPVAAKIMSLYPEPNTTTPGSVAWQNNFILNPNIGRFDFINLTARVDHQFSARQRVYGRWSWNDFTQLRNTNGIPGLAGDYRNGGKFNNGMVIDSITSITPATVLNLRASLNWWVEHLKPYGNEGFDMTQFGWPKELVAQLPRPELFPRIDISQARSLGASSGNVTFEPTTTLSLAPNLVLIRGRHTIKSGLDFRLVRYTQIRPGAGGGMFSFDRAFTRRDYLVQDALSGVGAASFLLGYAASGSVANIATPFWQWLYYAPWVQDDIRLTRRLTLNLGLRWDLNMPPTERFNRINRGFFPDQVNPIARRTDQMKFPGFQPKGGIGFAGVNGLPRTPYDPDWNNLQPRVGAAFQLTDRTILRGGYGLFFLNPIVTGNLNGFSQNTPYVASLDAGRTPANTISNPFPTGLLQPPGASLGLETFLGQGPSYTNPNFRTPYIHQFSFGIQRQLPGNMLLDVAYVGSRTRAANVSKGVNEIPVSVLALGDITKGGNPNYLNQQVPNPFAGLMPAGLSLNNATTTRQQLLRPFPQFTGFNEQQRNDGRIWYNSMQLMLTKRYSQGLSFTTTYTLSKNIEALDYLNAQDPAPTRTLTDWDRTHRLVLAPSYELPFGPGRRFLASGNPIVGRVVGGWQYVMTTTLQSGDPMSIPGGVWLIGDPKLDNPTWDRLFRTGVIDVNGAVRNVLPGEQPVFAVRPNFTLRTTPLRYGHIRNQWATTFDMSLIKNTRVREGINLQFRVDAFNAFNTPVFSGDPNLSPTDSNFGKIFRDTGQSNFPRNVQLGVRLVF